MSRVINIKGTVTIQNMQLAHETLEELNLDIEIKNNQFVFNKYDAWDKISATSKTREIEKVENLYNRKLNAYLDQVAEEERLRIEEEKRKIRKQKADLIKENAKKQGYKVKKEIQEDNTVKMVLLKRTY